MNFTSKCVKFIGSKRSESNGGVGFGALAETNFSIFTATPILKMK
jgi:hypothetical protein